MFCPNCGNQMSNDAKFCKECGWHRSEINNKKGINFNMPIISITSIIKGIIIILIIGIVVNFIIGKVNYKKTKDIYRTGIETTASGKIVYNKGNNIYAKNEIVKEGSNLYYFNSNEEMVKNDWVEYDGKWYYCESDGKIAKSKWVENTYYVDENGQMLKNTFTPDGYYVGDDGEYVDLNMNNINAQVNSNSLSEQINNAKLLTEYSEDTLIDQIDIVKFGSYPQSDASGNVKEPIEWIVLDRYDNRALLLSKYILDCKKYNSENIAITWEMCSLRNWLNNDFYLEAFDSNEQNRILTTNVINSNNSSFGTYGGNNTNDKILCLSIDEIRKYFGYGIEKYGGTSFFIGKRISTKATNFALSIYTDDNKIWKYGGNDWYKGHSPYWLRSSGSEQNSAADVSCGSYGIKGVNVDEKWLGIRPALWILY